MYYRKAIFLIPIAIALTACGYTDEGSGSNTLRISADLHYTLSSQNVTQAKITVLAANGEPITDATVILTEAQTHHEYSLPHADPNQPGLYSLEIAGYHQRMGIDVQQGQNTVNGALEGPGPHHITSPTEPAIFMRSNLNDTIEIRWATLDGIKADEIVIETEKGKYINTLTEDTGSVRIPTEKISNGNEVIKVTRRNRIQLAGGVGNSYIQLSFTAKIDLRVN